MNRLYIADFGSTDDPVNLQVAVRCRRRANTPGFVCELEIMHTAIGFAVNGNRFDPQFATSAYIEGQFRRDWQPVFFETC